jgi:hypothetical protein
VLRNAAVRGRGIALLPTFIAGADLQAGRLRTILTDFKAPEIDICAIYPEARHLSIKVRLFIDFLVDRGDAPSVPHVRPLLSFQHGSVPVRLRKCKAGKTAPRRPPDRKEQNGSLTATNDRGVNGCAEEQVVALRTGIPTSDAKIDVPIGPVTEADIAPEFPPVINGGDRFLALLLRSMPLHAVSATCAFPRPASLRSRRPWNVT